MQLFYTKSSPYANCVRMVISELGIQDAITMTISHPFDNADNFLKANPLGKVPCLIGDGESIVDSEVICDFLDANYTGGTLFNPVYADWRLKSLYSVCSGLIDSLVARRIEASREKDGQKSNFWWQRHSLAVTRTLAYMEEKLALMPEEFCILHINLASALAYLDFRHSDIDWRQNCPGLQQFYAEVSQRPCVLQNQLTDEP